MNLLNFWHDLSKYWMQWALSLTNTNCHFKILYLIAFMIICHIFLYIYCILCTQHTLCILTKAIWVLAHPCVDRCLSLASLSGQKVQCTLLWVSDRSSTAHVQAQCLSMSIHSLYCCTIWKLIKNQQSLNFLEETNIIHMTPEDRYSF